MHGKELGCSNGTGQDTCVCRACINKWTKSLKTKYNCYVRSILEYAQTIWNPQYHKYINTVENIQIKLLRRVHLKFQSIECNNPNIKIKSFFAESSTTISIAVISCPIFSLDAFEPINDPETPRRHPLLEPHMLKLESEKTPASIKYYFFPYFATTYFIYVRLCPTVSKCTLLCSCITGNFISQGH